MRGREVNSKEKKLENKNKTKKVQLSNAYINLKLGAWNAPKAEAWSNPRKTSRSLKQIKR